MPTQQDQPNLENQPNLFELSGGEFRVTYSTSSFAGPPQLGYQDAERELSFSGEEIETGEVSVGRVVTVVLGDWPDFGSFAFSFLLPLRFNLQDGESAFSTVGVRTTHRTSIGGPELVEGALQTYEAVELQGTARLVEF